MARRLMWVGGMQIGTKILMKIVGVGLMAKDGAALAIKMTKHMRFLFLLGFAVDRLSLLFGLTTGPKTPAFRA